MALKEYTVADGVLIEDLLQYGLDHIATAEHLFKQSASYYDGAGYLTHMGFELLLKAWLLRQIGSFPATHKLVDLLKLIKANNPTLEFTKTSGQTIAYLEVYAELRYPNRNLPIEIGSDQWSAIASFRDELWRQMPSEFMAIIKAIDPLKKGGRVLMQKKIE